MFELKTVNKASPTNHSRFFKTKKSKNLQLLKIYIQPFFKRVGGASVLNLTFVREFLATF